MLSFYKICYIADWESAGPAVRGTWFCTYFHYLKFTVLLVYLPSCLGQWRS